MTPPKKGVSPNIGKNFAEWLQFEDLAVKNSFSFITCIFLWEKNLELVSNAFFMNVFFYYFYFKKNSPQGLQIAAFQQSFSQCWWKRIILEGSLIQKPT